MLAIMDMMANSSFSTVTDGTYRWGCNFLSLMLFAGAVLCAYFVVLLAEDKKLSELVHEVEPVALTVGALVSLWVAYYAFWRIGSPTSLTIARVDETWSFILQRRSLDPVIKPLKELEAFVETFGNCSRVSLGEWGKRAGHTTSRGGTVHLFFAKTPESRAMSMCCSLQEPYPFFKRLRDICNATSHDLSGIAAEYIAEWGTSGSPRGSSRAQSEVAMANSPRIANARCDA